MVSAKKLATNGLKTKTLQLDKIRLDGDTQSREELDQDVIKEYSDLMEAGREFPPLLVVFDGAAYWLVDGFHRRWAAIKAKIKKFKCQVKEGTREDARWLSYAANIDHGLKRTNEDKQKAVISALKHPKGCKAADSKIAEHVAVSVATVGKYRKQLEAAFQIEKVTEREGADGKTYSTEKIGSGQTAAAAMRKEAMARAAEPAVKLRTQSDEPAAEPETGRPSGGVTFNPAEWTGDGKDGTGKEHTGEMRTVFETGDAIEKARQHLVNLKRDINRLLTLAGGELLQVAKQRIMADLDNLDTEIKFAKPFAPCCYCAGNPKHCKACKGIGWLNESTYKAAPKEKKRATA